MLKIYKNPALERRSPTQKPPIAISVAFYNQLPMLELVLAGLQRQSAKDFQIILCDDGSAPEVVKKIQDLLSKNPLPCLHLWHTDKGFRKNRMLNWGIHYCLADYMVFIDQDCVPHREFIKEHSENRKLKTALSGRRMELTPWQSRLLTPEKIREGFLEKNLWWLILSGVYMKDANGGKGIYLKPGPLRDGINKNPRALVGCNFSIHRQDLLDINGFDTRYEAPGIGEDSDIDFRLRLNGIKIQSFANAAVQYHAFHKLTKKPISNEKLFSEIQKEKQAKTKYGLQEQLAALITPSPM